ncbi:hypothetical protein KVR01_012428 [Diaporthe batatas]|uniref:uncharacterized protein n=1 Tax=Diaporthe batatas TaxID=748121 RepID=UPI001D04CDE7|nr:uncharacterized protein KVR01_012428 [Diaporthe batatas]KAG8157766.1 hypothetical protein KVR01_012428 [Diaporthe batatas]
MPDAEVVDQLFRSLAGSLSTAWTRDRLPYRYLETFHAASSAPSDDTSRIFLESGFNAWVAYLIAKPTTANAQGQAARRRHFEALDRLPASEKRRLALKVNEVPPHPTVASLSRSMEQEARPDGSAVANSRHSKRRRLEHDDLFPPSSPAYPSPSYSQSLNDNALVSPDAARRADPTVNGPVPTWTPHTAQGPSKLSPSAEPEILTGADIDELKIFPEVLREAIKRHDRVPRTAAVTFEFPRDSIADVNCFMSITIVPERVERIASLLFDNVYLATNGTSRELILPGGLCVLAKRLHGCRPQVVTDVLGVTVAAAVESAPWRKIELSDRGVDEATRCVMMTDFSDARDGAVLIVTLGRREASKMYEKLFKSSKSRFQLP